MAAQHQSGSGLYWNAYHQDQSNSKLERVVSPQGPETFNYGGSWMQDGSTYSNEVEQMHAQDANILDPALSQLATAHPYQQQGSGAWVDQGGRNGIQPYSTPQIFVQDQWSGQNMNQGLGQIYYVGQGQSQEYPIHSAGSAQTDAVLDASSIRQPTIQRVLLPNGIDLPAEDNRPATADGSAASSDWLCFQCSRSFSRRNDYERHESQVHRKIQRPRSCEICGFGFYYTKDLERHMKTHEDARSATSASASCSERGCRAKPFKRRDNLKRHFKRQHNIEIYLCKGKACLEYTADPNGVAELKRQHEAGLH